MARHDDDARRPSPTLQAMLAQRKPRALDMAMGCRGSVDWRGQGGGARRSIGQDRIAPSWKVGEGSRMQDEGARSASATSKCVLSFLFLFHFALDYKLTSL